MKHSENKLAKLYVIIHFSTVYLIDNLDRYLQTGMNLKYIWLLYLFIKMHFLLYTKLKFILVFLKYFTLYTQFLIHIFAYCADFKNHWNIKTTLIFILISLTGTFQKGHYFFLSFISKIVKRTDKAWYIFEYF